MKTVFAQRGIANCGKSSTIILLYDLLVAAYPDAVCSDVDPDKAPLRSGRDIRAVIRIGNFCVGIESQGDPNARLATTLPEFVKLPCDVIVCATRTRGETVEAVESLENDGYAIEWRERHRQADSSLHATANRQEAQWLLKQIQSAL